MTNKICDRTYGDGAYTAKIINGQACCTTCEQPLKKHPREETTDGK